MSKKKDKLKVTDNSKIIIRNIGDLSTELMKIYGANVNIMRHLADVFDGLKIGERRIIFTLFNDNKCLPDKKRLKVQKVMGDTLTYHPHGDAPVYETIVKLGQYFTNNYPLIDGHGNFGDIMGSKASAPRYIEARLSQYAYKCFFEDFSMDLVDKKMNYNMTHYEPEVIPSRYPNILINGVFGIGYSIMTGIPLYNLQEVIELTLKLIDDPLYEDVTLIPDFPTGCNIVDTGKFKEISETGVGTITMRGEIEVDEEKNELKIMSVPYQVKVENIIETLNKLQAEGKIRGIKDYKDESKPNSHEINRRIILKKEIDPYEVLDKIYRLTDMQSPFTVRFKLIDEYAVNDYDIRSVLLTWIEYRKDFKIRYYNHMLSKYMERHHILKTLIKILDGTEAGERALNTIRRASSRAEIIKFLCSEFGITSLQAEAIAKMPLSSFSKDSVEGYKKEMKDKEKVIENYMKIIRSDKKLKKVIKEELQEGIELFGRERMCKVVTPDNKDVIRDTKHTIVFTMNGFVKKLPENTPNIGYIAPNDYPIEITKLSNTTDLLIFDESGKISKLPIHKLPSSELKGEGEKLNKFCKVNGKIVSIIPKPSADHLAVLKEPVWFLMLTENGLIKKTPASSYLNIKSELAGMIVKDNDRLKDVKVLIGNKDVLVYTNTGYGVRFPSDTIRETNRLSIGIKALDLNSDETAFGLDIMNPQDKYIFVLTNRGNAKKCTLDTFRTMNRASKSLRIVTLEDNEDIMIIKTLKGDEVYRAYLKGTTEDIDIKDVVELPRMSKAKKIIPVRKGEVIIDIKKIK